MHRSNPIICATLLLIATSRARAATPINACGTEITSPGSYVVTKNLEVKTGSTNGCISFKSDYVTIDLGGFTIDCGGQSVAGITDGGPSVHTGIIVRNGAIVGCGPGLILYNAALIDGITVRVGTNSGIVTGLNGAAVFRSISEDNGFDGISVGIATVLDNTVLTNSVKNLDAPVPGSATFNNLAP